MIALPGQLFYTTQIPVCLWFFTRNKNDGKRRDRRGETLFVDARKMGSMVSRVNRELTAEDIAIIADTYHLWRGDQGYVVPPSGGSKKDRLKAELRTYEDVPGFCYSATTEEIGKHGFVLTPGRYVGAEEIEDDGEPFEEKMPRLVAELNAQFAESANLEQSIKANLRGLGYGG